MQNSEPRLARTLAYLVAIVLVTATPAHAYLDPGTGSLILQVLAAGALTVWFTIRGSWQRVKMFVARIFQRPKGD